MTNLDPLIDRVESAVGPDRELDREIGEALGWHQRKVTGLGMNGRTPGRWLWFPPFDPNASWPQKPKTLPAFTGPRKRAATLAALRSLSSQGEGHE